MRPPPVTTKSCSSEQALYVHAVEEVAAADARFDEAESAAGRRVPAHLRNARQMRGERCCVSSTRWPTQVRIQMPQDGHRFRAHRDHAAVAAERRQHRAQRMDVDGRGLAGARPGGGAGAGKAEASEPARSPATRRPAARLRCLQHPGRPRRRQGQRVGCLVADYDVAGQDREQPIATRYARQLGQVKQRLGQLVSQPRHRLPRSTGRPGSVRSAPNSASRRATDGTVSGTSGQLSANGCSTTRPPAGSTVHRVRTTRAAPTGPWPQLHEALQGHNRVLVVGVQFRFHQRAAAAAAVPDKHRPSTGSGVNPRTGHIAVAQGGHVKQRDGWPTRRGAASEPSRAARASRRAGGTEPR